MADVWLRAAGSCLSEMLLCKTSMHVCTAREAGAGEWRGPAPRVLHCNQLPAAADIVKPHLGCLKQSLLRQLLRSLPHLVSLAAQWQTPRLG